MASDDEYEIPESGAIFTFGRNGFADNQPSHFFIRNDPIVEISCGDEHTAVICEKGRVFVFGHNDYGQLGLGHTKLVSKPSCLKYLKPFNSTHVACGKGHTLVSTDCGRLFSFGSNSDGQLGLGNVSDSVIPQLINTEMMKGANILSLSAGCFHSACLTDFGELYLWGNNSDGQCGIETDSLLLTPTKLDFDNAIHQVSCGYYHTAIISCGNLYTFGESDGGKLGYKREKAANSPEKTALEFTCVQVSCGGNHTLVLSDEGIAFSFGSNFSGQLGIGNNNGESYSPVPVNFPKNNKIILVSAGESHSAFITENGELYTFGDSRYGKICRDYDSMKCNTPTLVALFDNFICTSVCCGGCHTMILAKLKVDSSIGDISKPRNKITTLPPLKTKKTFCENEKNLIEIQEINEKNVTQESIDTQETSSKRPQSTGRTKIPMNEEVISRDDNTSHLVEKHNLEVAQVEVPEIENTADVNPRNASALGTGKTLDTLARPEGKMNKIINILKRKKSDDFIIVHNTSTNEATDNFKNDVIDRRNRNQRQSRTCSVL